MIEAPGLYFLFAANWITAAAYFAIPFVLHKVRLKGVEFGLLNHSIVFEVFILACGLHHLVHPLAMLYGWWFMQVGVDFFMAFVSATAAWTLLKTLRETPDGTGH